MLPVVLLVAFAALGAAGLYLAMPAGRRHAGGLALVLLAAAGGVLLALLAPRLAGGATRGWFVVLALVGVLGAVRMITHRLPVYSALYFILVVVSVTGMLVLMEAGFVAAALLLIYAGAILVTYVFVIMLAQQSGPAPYDRRAREPLLGCVAGFLVLTVIAGRLLLGAPDATGAPAVSPPAPGGVLPLGTWLLTECVLVVQMAGVLLLAGLVGAIAIARRRAIEAALEEAD